MARVAVVGVGAIGGVVAGLLQIAGRHEILLCTRKPITELRVETPDGLVIVKAKNLTDPEQGERVDWVMVATKTYDIDGAKMWLKRLCGEGTVVAAIQNGVEHRENFGAQPVLPVVIDVPCERRADGSVLQRSNAVMRVEQSAVGEAFAALFAGTKATVEVTDDFLSAAWRKLCLNAAGVISALTLKPQGVMRDEALGLVALELVRECAAVGRAVGAKLDDDIAEKVLASSRAGSPDSINSLLADRMAGRRTEIEARNGVIVRLGEKHGIATPANRMAVALFKAME
jgi:2-dehydropantoate 2-reductase